MAEDATIAALFNLPGSSLRLCDEKSCIILVDYLSKFHKHVVEHQSCHPWASKAELDALDSALKILQATTPQENVGWIPDYGCAVLKSEAGCTPGEITLNLISLHLHRFQTISKLSSNGYNYVDDAISSDYEVLPIGTCTLNDLEDIHGKFWRLLASTQSQNGRQNTRSGKQGHQRTPALIHALYGDAFGSPNQTPRGGFAGFAEVDTDTAW